MLNDSWEKLRPKVTEQLIAEVIRRIVNRFNPLRVILFGSYAWGHPHLYSDLDLLVILESNDPMVDRMVQVADEAEIPFLPMDVLVYTPRELNERLMMGDHFFQDIMSKGKVLYDVGVVR